MGMILGFMSKDNHYLSSDYENFKGKVKERVFKETAWKNEKVTGEFIVLREEGILEENDEFTLKITDLSNESGEKIKTENIEFSLIKPVRAEGEMIPDILEKVESFSFKDEKFKSFWFSIKVPENCEKGIYKGKIKIIQGEEVKESLSINLEVLDITLPSVEEWTFHLDLWQNPYSVARYFNVELWSEEHFNYLKPHMERLKNAGQKVITTTIVHDPWKSQTYDPYESMVKWIKKEDGSFEFDYSIFDKWVEFCMDIGIDKQINAYTMVSWNEKFKYFDEIQGEYIIKDVKIGGEEWNENFRQFIVSFKSHLEEKGWKEKTYIAMDERPVETMKAVFELLDGTGFKISGAMNYGNVGEIVDKIDEISMSSNEVNENFQKIFKDRKEKGKVSTYYVCTGLYPNVFTKSKPAEGVWLGWYAEKCKVDGFLRWAYDSWVENPLETTDHVTWESGDCFLVYPERSSLRFERLFEGIQDNEKIRYIRKKYKEYENKVDEILEELKRGYSPNDGVDFSFEINKAKKSLEKLTKTIISRSY